MASDKYTEPLLFIGPYDGLDTTTIPPLVPKGKMADCSNASPAREGATRGIASERGRNNIATFTVINGNTLAGNYTLTEIAPMLAITNNVPLNVQPLVVMDFKPTDPAINLPLIAYYNLQTNGVQVIQGFPVSFVPNAGGTFTQCVQFGNTLYSNGGWQWTPQPDMTSAISGIQDAQAWQYPPPDNSLFNFSLAQSTTGGGHLVPGQTYYYAFTQQVTSGFTGNTQETSGVGQNSFVFSIKLTGTNNTVTVGTTFAFDGTETDGTPFKTNIYRLSTQQPTWQLLAANVTGASYTDTASDASIAANRQLLTHDCPPCTNGGVYVNNPTPIAEHKNRMWVFSHVTSAATNNKPQVQLWFSDDGVPWSFDQVNQVMLVGQNATPSNLTYTDQGDHPVALASLGSVLLAFKNRTTWTIIGDDQTSFVPRKLFDVGCVSQGSVIVSQGVCCWLSEHGVYVFDGTYPQIVSNDIRRTLEDLTPNDLQASQASYSHNTYYLSFPISGITLAWCVTTNAWFKLPYACTSSFSIPANPSAGFYVFGEWLNQVVANRNDGSPSIDFWFASNDDLNAANPFSLTCPLTDSGMPSWEKEYQWITLLAPYQSATATVTLTVDGGVDPGGTYSITFDLSSNPQQPMTRHVQRVPADFVRGYLAEMTVSSSTPHNASAPTKIYGAAVWGVPHRNLVQPV